MEGSGAGRGLRVKVDSEWLEAEGVRFSISDIVEGWQQGMLGAHDVIRLATNEVTLGSDEPLMVELVCLLRSDVDKVGDLLGVEPVDSCASLPETIHGPFRRKLAFLALRRLYLRREEEGDGFWERVEAVWCDLGHPEELEGFIRWMPAPLGQESGEDAMMRRLEDFLEAGQVQWIGVVAAS